MSGTVADKKRILRITAGNLRQKHIYLNGHFDFFPSDTIGASSESKGKAGNPIRIHLAGLNQTIETDIGCDRTTGKPRNFFRGRKWVRQFFEYHHINTGDLLAIERMGKRSYRLRPFNSKTDRRDDWQGILEKPLKGKGFKVLELFAGCGGMALGFKKAGFRSVMAVEWDPAACETLRANITGRVAQCAVEEIDPFPQADVVIGGPPCQGFSNLGDKVPCDPRRQLWRHFMRAVKDAAPEVFIMENVPPILKSQEYQEIVRIAKTLGFQVNGKVLNAADYGVPQTRKRAIIIGVKNGFPSFPQPTHTDPKRKDLLTSELKPWVTVRDAIGDLPLTPTEINWHIGRHPTPLSLERYSFIPPGGNRFDLPDRLKPECWKKKTKGGTDLFGRLWWDRPSVTIRTEFYKPEKGRYLHPVADRPITHREAARLQGFPDDFDFKGKRIQVGIQIGNAVPPLLAETIAKHIISILKSERITQG